MTNGQHPAQGPIVVTGATDDAVPTTDGSPERLPQVRPGRTAANWYGRGVGAQENLRLRCIGRLKNFIGAISQAPYYGFTYYI